MACDPDQVERQAHRENHGEDHSPERFAFAGCLYQQADAESEREHSQEGALHGRCLPRERCFQPRLRVMLVFAARGLSAVAPNAELAQSLRALYVP